MPKVMGLAFYVKCPCLVFRTPFALSYLWIFTHVLPSSWNTFPKVFPPHLFFSLPLKIQLVVEYLAWMSHPLKSFPFSPTSSLGSASGPSTPWPSPVGVFTMACSNHMVTFLLEDKGQLPQESGQPGPSPCGSWDAQHSFRVQLIQVLVDVGQVLLTLSTDVHS